MKVLRIATFLAAVTMAQSASAETLYCSGTLGASWTNRNGDVFFQPSWHWGHLQLCNIHLSWKDVTPSTCLSWQAKVDAAVTLQRQTTINYEGTACGALATYADSPSPYYVMVR